MATLVLMTGLHLSFASHYCGGNLVAVKFSVAGKHASCGMESQAGSSQPAGKIFKSDCCADEVTNLAVDPDYSISSWQGKDLTQKVMPYFAIPVAESVKESHAAKYFGQTLSPPGSFRQNTVELAVICVFRI